MQTKARLVFYDALTLQEPPHFFFLPSHSIALFSSWIERAFAGVVYFIVRTTLRHRLKEQLRLLLK